MLLCWWALFTMGTRLQTQGWDAGSRTKERRRGCGWGAVSAGIGVAVAAAVTAQCAASVMFAAVFMFCRGLSTLPALSPAGCQCAYRSSVPPSPMPHAPPKILSTLSLTPHPHPSPTPPPPHLPPGCCTQLTGAWTGGGASCSGRGGRCWRGAR